MLYSLRRFIYSHITVFFRTTRIGNYSGNAKIAELNAPLDLDPKKVTIEDYVRLQPGLNVIAQNGLVVIKKYSAVGANTTIIPGSHIPTVGLPQYLSTTHINDKDSTITIGEDCWIGAGSFLLSHASVGRGCVVAAGSIVTKTIPPYAVIAGSPAKIIASRFTIEQILEHEKQLYPASERMSKDELVSIFDEYYSGKRSLGTSEMSNADKEKLAVEKKRLGIPSYDL